MHRTGSSWCKTDHATVPGAGCRTRCPRDDGIVGDSDGRRPRAPNMSVAASVASGAKMRHVYLYKYTHVCII